MLLLLAIFK